MLADWLPGRALECTRTIVWVTVRWCSPLESGRAGLVQRPVLPYVPPRVRPPRSWRQPIARAARQPPRDSRPEPAAALHPPPSMPAQPASGQGASQLSGFHACKVNYPRSGGNHQKQLSRSFPCHRAIDSTSSSLACTREGPKERISSVQAVSKHSIEHAPGLA